MRFVETVVRCGEDLGLLEDPPIDISAFPEKHVLRDRFDSFARSVIGTGFANLVATGFGALGGLILALSFSATDRGAFAIVTVWPISASMIALVGLPQSVSFHVAKNEDMAPSTSATGLSMGLIISVFVGLIGFGASGLITGDPDLVPLLRRLFILLPLFTIPIVAASGLQPRHIQSWNIIRATQPATYFGILSVLALGGSLSPQSGTNALIASLLVQLVMALLLLRFHLGPLGLPDRNLIRPLASYGLRTALATTPFLFNQRFDQLILSIVVRKQDLGNYVLAVTLSMLATPIAYAFGYVAFAQIPQAETEESRHEIRRRAMKGSLLAAALVLAPLVALAPFVVPRLFGSGYSQVPELLLILSVGTMFLAGNQVAEDILRGLGRPGIPAIAEFGGTMVTALLLIFLVPLWGVHGAALASVLAYASVRAVLRHHLKELG